MNRYVIGFAMSAGLLAGCSSAPPMVEHYEETSEWIEEHDDRNGGRQAAVCVEIKGDIASATKVAELRGKAKLYKMRNKTDLSGSDVLTTNSTGGYSDEEVVSTIEESFAGKLAKARISKTKVFAQEGFQTLCAQVVSR